MNDYMDAVFRGYPQDPDEVDALMGIAKRTYALFDMLQRAGFNREEAFDLVRIDFTGIVSMSLEMMGGEDESTGV